MTMPELTEDAIAEGMTPAKKVACRPGDDRCYPFPDPVEMARASGTPPGRCRVGWILANSGRDAWDVWLDLHTGRPSFSPCFTAAASCS
jgi:hypothetical protein